MSITVWIVSGILFILSGIHVYWVFGGRMGVKAVIPSNGREAVFRPGRMATGLVAVALAIAGWFVLELGEVVERILFSDWFYIYAGWALTGVFVLRAIGDFRLLGFFKKERGTLFAKWDTMLYSPLCLFIGICVMVIIW